MNKRIFLIGLGIILAACTPYQFAPTSESQVPAGQHIAGNLNPRESTRPGSVVSLPGDGPDLEISVRAVLGRTIRFKTQNGQTLQGVPSQALDLPDLVLHRNGELSSPPERSLQVEVRGIRAFPGVTQVSILLETQHKDPDQAGASSPRIVAWSHTIAITNTSEISQAGVSILFEHEFNATIPASALSTPTPTDYYRLEVQILDASYPGERPGAVLSREFAFLLEDAWSVPLPETLETSPGAAPDKLVVYACDMFIVPIDGRASGSRLSRQQFPGFLQKELIPRMIAAYHLQTEGWRFPWHREWTGYRPEEEPKALSISLTNGEDWFHGSAPVLGDASISINLADPLFYDRHAFLEGFTTIYQHELFHNLERNINLHAGGNGGVNGKGESWSFFTEGMAVAAESVANPPVEFLPATSWEYFFLEKTNVFIQANLNSQYGEMSYYNAALYWRFLYEKCEGLKNGVVDPEAGMQILRRVLEVLYSKEIVDIDSSVDLVPNLPAVMDRSLDGSSCPFQEYASSLVAFARAIYGLRLQGGRCSEPGFPDGCGMYDPKELYVSPDVTVLRYTGSKLAYSAEELPSMKDQQSGGDSGYQGYLPDIPGSERAIPPEIPCSFGMDFVEIALDAQENGQPLAIEFQGESGSPARFHVEILLLLDEGEGQKPLDVTSQLPVDEIETMTTPDGHVLYTIRALDLSAYNRIGLIITRLDAEERLDPEGKYSIMATPGR